MNLAIDNSAVSVRARVGSIASRSAVIEALLEFGPTSRSDLANLTQLSRAALTEISHDLIKHGLVYEIAGARENPGKGRPSVLLSLNAEHGYFVGVNITCAPSLMVLTDLQGNVVSEFQIEEARTPQTIAKAIRSGIAHLLEPKGISTGQVLGIGLALSGFVDYLRGVCMYSAALNWSDVPISDIVKRSTGIPTYIDNDANAVATGEKLFGKAREARDFSILTLGESVGCAHYTDGKLYRGNAGGAGEIGHITTTVDGKPCRCGKRGCLDTIAGVDAILAEAREHDLPVKSVGELEELAANGDAQAIAILRDAGHALGLAVASVIQINNPELILFADTESFGNGLFTTVVRQTIENNILPRFLSSTRLLFHPVEPSFLARGAASIAAHAFLIEQAASRT